MTNTPGMLRAMGKICTDLGVRPEIEAFDSGHLWLAKQLADEGVIATPALVQMCMGIPWGAPDDLHTFLAMVNAIPDDWTFSAFSIGRNEMPFVAASVLAGGNVRVGLEDNLWLDKGVQATNALLVERAVRIVSDLGANIMEPQQVREKLALRRCKNAPHLSASHNKGHNKSESDGKSSNHRWRRDWRRLGRALLVTRLGRVGVRSPSAHAAPRR